MLRTRHAATSADSASSVSLVVPRGTGTPSARKVTALPMCASATRSVRLAGEERRLLGQQGERPAGGRDRRRHASALAAQAANRRSATSRCSVGLLRKPERAKRCRRPIANAVSTDACALASTVGVVEPFVLGVLAQALAQLRLDALEELVHARGQPVVLEHQRVADHDARHARVLLAELEQHGEDAAAPARRRPARARRSG